MEQQDLLVLLLGFALGAWAFYSGMRGLRRGRILASSRQVSIEEQPLTFWFVVLVLRFAVGLLLVAGAVYQSVFAG